MIMEGSVKLLSSRTCSTWNNTYLLLEMPVVILAGAGAEGCWHVVGVLKPNEILLELDCRVPKARGKAKWKGRGSPGAGGEVGSAHFPPAGPARPPQLSGPGGLGASPPNLNVPAPRPHLPPPTQLTLRSAALWPRPRAPLVDGFLC